MRILRAADHKVMPWKNGLGSTTEIAVSPGRENLDDFAWRVSMAQVENNGAFSLFPGIDRTLLVLAGHGMILDVDGHAPAALTRDSAPHTFPGDTPTAATLIDGPIVDLNIMARRGVVLTSVQRIKLLAGESFSASDAHLLFVEEGAVAFQSGSGTEIIGPQDALLLEKYDTPLALSSAPTASLVSIQLDTMTPNIHRF